jgi:cytochrome c2
MANPKPAASRIISAPTYLDEDNLMRGIRHLLQVELAISFGLILACLLGQANLAGFADDKSNQAQRGMVIVKPIGYKPQPVSVESKKGNEFYEQAHCSACHSINDEGGVVGPMLDGVGRYRSGDFLYARLANTPESMNTYAKLTDHIPNELAPHVRLAPSAARALVAYLLTLPEPPSGFAISSHSFEKTEPEPITQPEKFQPAPKTASSEEGRQLYEKFACAECHQIQHVGGFIAPSLDGIGAYRSRDYIAAHVTDAQAHAVRNNKFFELVPTPMPRFKATAEEIQKITDYLMTLPQI